MGLMLCYCETKAQYIRISAIIQEVYNDCTQNKITSPNFKYGYKLEKRNLNFLASKILYIS